MQSSINPTFINVLMFNFHRNCFRDCNVIFEAVVCAAVYLYCDILRGVSNRLTVDYWTVVA